mmetsp:Transcript_2390/g.5409  ORF Transcript_2390/g.5409 Transcript_2390/m.5409 type:complete len:260 (+) Transcript_2390:319-1098(+)
MGVRHEPSSAARNARSHVTPIRVSSWLSSASRLSADVSPVRTVIPMAPCAMAGSISSMLRIAVAWSSMPRRFSPARARSVASTCPSSSLRMRLCTLPRKLTTFNVLFCARSWHWRRRDAEPIVAPSASSATLVALLEMRTSRTSSRGSMQGNSIPSGRYVGTSFIECTAMSMRPSSSASSSSRVNSPLPPMSASGWSSTLSPVVLMMTISKRPSSLSSGNAPLSRSRVMYACAMASGEPRVPILTVSVVTAAAACVLAA